MQTNFEIEENYAINFNGIHIDLHNNFDFKKISEIDDSIHIEFNKTKGDWVNKNEFDKIIFQHKKINFKRISIDKLNPSKNLNEITFYPKVFRKKNNEIIINIILPILRETMIKILLTKKHKVDNDNNNNDNINNSNFS